MRKEREQLINLVKLQAKEMEVRVCAAELVVCSGCCWGWPHPVTLQALKAEINMLRHKGGHIYTPMSRQ
jgi:hypothetical protein